MDIQIWRFYKIEDYCALLKVPQNHFSIFLDYPHNFLEHYSILLCSSIDSRFILISFKYHVKIFSLDHKAFIFIVSLFLLYCLNKEQAVN
jgi:hypothetical protein